VTEKLSVKVPAGVDEGMKIRLHGKGDLGDPGGPPGDLYVTLHVRSHEFFQREGNDVLTTVPISYAAACLGSPLEVTTIDGTERLTVPRGTPSGKVFTLVGKGIPSLNERGRGNHLVQVVVHVPTNLSSEEESLIKQLAELQSGKKREAEAAGKNPDGSDASKDSEGKSKGFWTELRDWFSGES
jgi:molecular chaperone DnaJ